jgi:cytochrome c551/c552
VIVEEFEPLEEADQLVHLKHRADYFAFEFTGTLLVKEAGVYGFRTQSDDGSFVYVDGELVVDNGGFHGVLSAEGSVELKVGAHSVRILYFEGGGGNELMVHWSGPGFDERPLRGDDLVYRTLPMQPLQAKVFSADPARVERGQTQFTKLGCVACHEAPTLQAPAFGAWNVQSSTGCLSPTPGLGAPRYGWSPEQQAAVREQVEKLDSLAPQTAAQRVQGLMARNSCYACHRRDEIGGPHPARGDYFASQPGVDLGEEGRIPPLLDAVGSKLHRDWLHKVLSEGASARPALLTRMPQFAADNMEALEAALVEADALTNPPRPGPFSAEAMSAGRQLAGTQGFGCIQCHTFNGYRSLGIQAVDLGDVTERIQYPWFRELLEDPVGLGMNSRMPLFWIDGKSPLPDLLGGDIEAQIDALWNYLAMGDSMQLPEGLNVPDSAYEVDIQPGDDPKVVGVFMRGLSPRVVAVGTGALVHYAFDVENSRLAKAWRGRFFNARGTWEGRAGQLELPPTQEVHEFPEGSPFAILEDAQGAWPTTENRAPLLRSRGRRFDEERRPIFRYALGEIEIEETPVTFLEGSQGVLVRRFKLRAPQRITKLYYQSARGRQRVTFEVTPDGSYKATLEERITW